MDLNKLASLFRTIQLYAHLAHNKTKGPTFFQDHGYFSDLYNFAEDCYDSLIERSIGLGNEVDIVKITEQSVKVLKEIPQDDFFKHSLALVETAVKQCESVAKNKSLGTNNLIAGLADSLEVHIYKLKQCIGSAE